jgi:foldase protein PrsA
MIKRSKKLKAILCALLLAGMITGCSANNASASNEALIKFNQGSISQEELFNKMVKTSGMPAALELADQAILNDISPVTEEMKTNAAAEMDKIKAYYADSFKSNLEASGFKTEEEFLDVIVLNTQRNDYISKYIEENVLTDEDIQKYYDAYEPTITASHILIMPAEDTTDGWNKALQTAKGLIERLNKGEDFATLAKENSKDPGSAANGGDLGAFGKGKMVPEFETAAYALKVNEYTKEPVKTTYGYHIILKTAEETKGTLEGMHSDIVKALSQKILQNDNTIANKALVKMRSDNGLIINNEVIKAQYDAFVEKLQPAETTKDSADTDTTNTTDNTDTTK